MGGRGGLNERFGNDGRAGEYSKHHTSGVIFPSSEIKQLFLAVSDISVSRSQVIKKFHNFHKSITCWQHHTTDLFNFVEACLMWTVCQLV